MRHNYTHPSKRPYTLNHVFYKGNHGTVSILQWNDTTGREVYRVAYLGGERTPTVRYTANGVYARRVFLVLLLKHMAFENGKEQK